MALPLKRGGSATAFYPIPLGLAKMRAGILWGYLRMNMASDGGPARVGEGRGPAVLPDEHRIATDLGTTARTVRRWARALEAAGWLVGRRDGTGRGNIVFRWALLKGCEAVEGDLALPTKADTTVPLPRSRRRTELTRKADKRGRGRRTKMSGHNNIRKRHEKKRENGDGPPPSRAALSQGNGTATANGHDERRDSEDDGNDTATADRERLIALTFPDGVRPKQRAAALKIIAETRARGVTAPWIAHALTSEKLNMLRVWRRFDHAVDTAASIVRGVNKQSRKQFQDLRHLVAYVQVGGLENLPRSVGGFAMDSILRQATEWPDSGQEKTS